MQGRIVAIVVVLGILALLRFGAKNAEGQAPSNPVVGAVGGFVLTADGDVYQSPSGDGVSWVRRGNVFGLPSTSDPVVGSVGGFVLTAGGNVYQCPVGDGVTWVLRGNVFGVPTGTTPASWGALKAKYR